VTQQVIGVKCAKANAGIAWALCLAVASSLTLDGEQCLAQPPACSDTQIEQWSGLHRKTPATTPGLATAKSRNGITELDERVSAQTSLRTSMSFIQPATFESAAPMVETPTVQWRAITPIAQTQFVTASDLAVQLPLPAR
jgi:hypothetical protein